ncbi:D-erythrulose reductase-like [Mya arenaria]|uniref:D-erythrulose reductase-like n=1 Tax=Mya arenaria TaxID=6604 RepID=UPI0022E0AE14|nr:D-erythrulose reductase-like [Mya arenaria]
MSFDFKGKSVLVTGASRGIGRELSVALVRSGAIVYALATNGELLEALKQECGEDVRPIVANLRDWDATRAVLEPLPPMDGLVNNAGVSYEWTPSLEVSKELIDKTFEVNIMAAINVTQAVGKKMAAAGKGGSIVNVSSINGLNPMRECMPYNLSKAALDMMTKQFALELGPKKIRVNSVNPTVALTDMGREFWTHPPEKGDLLRSHTPLGRFAEVSEVVQPIMYLLSDCSSMVTGTVNPIEGGLLSNIQC